MRLKGQLDEQLEREFIRAKIRSTNAIAEKNELKNKIIAQEYIARDDANKLYADIVAKVKQKFLGLGGKVAVLCENVSAGEAQEIIDDAVNEILIELAATIS